MAERQTIFAGAFFASLRFPFGGESFGLETPGPEAAVDWMLPVPLPFSLGFSAGLLESGKFGGGARLGYHVNFDDPNLDAYALYAMKAEFVQDEYAYVEWYPAIGVRRRFGDFF